MCALHLNAVQFYDWMYRHDKLLPDSELYSDPMGRPTSLAVIEGKIAACKKLGMRPFAYGAVYAATARDPARRTRTGPCTPWTGSPSFSQAGCSS